MKKIFFYLFIFFTAGCANPFGNGSTAHESFHPGIPSEIIQVQKTPIGTQPGGLTVSASFATAPTRGNAILIYAWSYSNVAAINIPATSCTDNQGHSYNLAVGAANISGANRLGTAICYITNIDTPTGTFTVTVSPALATPTTQIQVVAVEYYGMASNPVDKTMVNSGNSAAATTASTAVTTTRNELVGAIINSAAGANPIIFTSLNGFTTIAIQSNCAGFACGQAVSKTGIDIASYIENWTVNVAAFYNTVIATFRPQ